MPTKKKLDSGDGGYFYVAFVNGPVLDEHANQDRLGFALEETTGETVFDDDLPSIQQIAEAVGVARRKFLAADIGPLEEEHRLPSVDQESNGPDTFSRLPFLRCYRCTVICSSKT